MTSEYLWICLILLVAMMVTIITKKLTVAAALCGGVIGILIFAGAGFVGLIMLAAFFVLGTAATAWQINTKEKAQIAEKNEGQRTIGQVFANAGLAAILSAIAILFPEYAVVLILMIAASFSSATADTLSSELGNIYGSKYYNVLTLKKDEKGLDGVVSVEGTLCGIAGSIIVACIYSISIGFTIHFVWIVIAGTIGNLTDSIIGATLERANIIKNNSVNFLNTLVGAVVALLLSL